MSLPPPDTPLVWHRHGSFYWAGEYPIYARRISTRSWELRYNFTLTADLDAVQAWTQRNEDLWVTRFPSFSELKAVVQATLAVDPIPEDVMLSERALRREAPGIYCTQVGKEKFRIIRTKKGSWKIFQGSRAINDTEEMPTLFAARTYISGTCHRDLARDASVA